MKKTLSLLAVILLLGASTVYAQDGIDTLEHGDFERTFTTYVPTSYDGSEAVPLVIVLHPFASSGKAMEALTGFDAQAEQAGFIVVYPDAPDEDWNDGSQAISPLGGMALDDDVAFMSALIDHVSTQYTIDPDRVYLTGFGAGGTMAYRLACETPERFAKIAVAGALMWDFHLANCPVKPEPEPVSLLVMIGTKDYDYPLAGRSTEDGIAQSFSVNETLGFWAKRNGCDLDAPHTGSDVVQYGDCNRGTSVTGYVLNGVGHNWPRTGDYVLNQFGIDMTEMLARYFMDENSALDLLNPPVDTSELYAGEPRTYILYVPPSYDPAEPMPLVIALHGRPGTAAWMAYYYDLKWVAQKYGFMVLYPEGLPVRIPGYTGIGREWNYTRGFPAYQSPDQPNDTDDVDFLTRLVDDLALDVNIDRRRVYVTGFSNGGFMALRVACEAPDTFAAYGAISGTLLPEMTEFCDVGAPVPILLMHGTHDPVVLWDGIAQAGQQLTLSAPDTALYWALHNECDPMETDYDVLPTQDDTATTQVHRYAFQGCTAGADVLFYVIEGGGHHLPGTLDRLEPQDAPSVNMDVHIGEVLWAFFKDYTTGE